MRFRRLAAAAVLLCAAGSSPATAQLGLEPVYEQPRWMLGYVASAPEMLLGGMVAFLPERLGGWGLYLDAKTALEDPGASAFFQPDITPSEAEDVLLDEFSSEDTHWRSFNAAVVRAFREDVIVYAGGGLSERHRYLEYFDFTQERGQLGFYWVEDESSSGWEPNALAGMYFRLLEHVAVQFGAETTPFGVTVGLIAAF